MQEAALSDSALCDTYLHICRISTWLVTAVTLVEAVALAALGEQAWRYPAALSLWTLMLQWGMSARRGAEAFVGLLILVLVGLSATATALTQELGAEAGFHIPLYAVVLLIAVAGRIGPPSRCWPHPPSRLPYSSSRATRDGCMGSCPNPSATPFAAFTWPYCASRALAWR